MIGIQTIFDKLQHGLLGFPLRHDVAAVAFRIADRVFIGRLFASSRWQGVDTGDMHQPCAAFSRRGRDIPRTADVDGPLTLEIPMANMRVRGRMNDRIETGHRAGYGLLVADVAASQFDFHVGKRTRVVVFSDQHRHVMVLLDKPTNHVVSNEAGSSSYEDPHGCSWRQWVSYPITVRGWFASLDAAGPPKPTQFPANFVHQSMPELTIQPVESKQQQRWFLRLPWDIYRDDPHWIPPLRQNQKELVGYAPHPFYQDADARTFLAMRNGRPCGRVAALINHAHNRRYDEQLGFFGFFESVDDTEVAAGLFEAARAWLRQHGIEHVRGPCNPSLNYELGLLVDGFDSPPTFMMTYNPPYYERLIEAAGFRKEQDLYAFWGHVDMLQSLDEKLAFILQEATRRFDVKMRCLDRRRFAQEVKMFLDIYNRSLVGTWGFVPLSDAEVEHIGESLKHLIVPEMTSVAEVDGKPVGAVFGLLDYNPRIKRIDGRLFPLGFLRLLWNRRQIKRVRLISTNVLPEYQRWGLGLVLMGRLVPEALKWGIEEAEFSWVLESNHLSRATLERGGAKLTKTYRIYDSRPEVDNRQP